jgi:hypothetical protein
MLLHFSKFIRSGIIKFPWNKTSRLRERSREAPANRIDSKGRAFTKGQQMDELIEQVVQKTGIPADQARKAVETVLAFLKSKLPDVVGGQLDQVVAGGAPGGVVDAAKNALGGLLGK